MSGVCLEFVGGPLDGRRDIVTPVHLTHFRYDTCMPLPVAKMVTAGECEIPTEVPYTVHIYRRGSLRKCGPEWDGNDGYWQDVWWDAWIYDGFSG